MMKIIISLLLILFIGACAQKLYTHATNDGRDFERARYECEKIARHQAKESGATDNPFVIADKTDKCLQLNGWTPKQ